MKFDERKSPVADGDPDPLSPSSERERDPETGPCRTADDAAGAPVSEQVPVPLVPGKERSTESRKGKQVRVRADLHDLVTGMPITPEDVEQFRRRHLLGRIIHGLLMWGLAASTAAMIAGLVLEAIHRHGMPQHVPQFREALRLVLSLDGPAFLALGLLLLIATPILRVMGTFFVFLYERDRRFAGATLVVLAILFVSIMFGKA